MPADLAIKYVIVKPLACAPVPLLFACVLAHRDAVAGVLAKGATVIAAGFCCFDGNGKDVAVRCWGRSDTLGSVSRPDADASLIRSHVEMGRA